MEDRKLNEKESLELITRMIQNTQNKLEENSGRLFLLWGYVSVLIALAIWYLKTSTGDWRWGYLWFSIPAILFPLTVYTYKKRKYVNTFIDRVLKYVWVVIGLSGFAVSSMTLLHQSLDSMFFNTVLMGVGVTISGLIIRMKPIVYSGIVGIALAFVMLNINQTDQTLIFVLVFLVILIIPGHILNRKTKKQN